MALHRGWAARRSAVARRARRPSRMPHGLVTELVDTHPDAGDLVVCPLLDDGHPDHAATARATVAAAALAGAGAVRCFPIWAWHCHDPATTVSHGGSPVDPSARAQARAARVLRVADERPRAGGPGDDPASLPTPRGLRRSGERTVNVDLEAFDRRYRSTPTLGVRASRYEQARYDTTSAGSATRLPSRFEPGCSIGVLTERLAAPLSVVACDVSPTAIAPPGDGFATPRASRSRWRRFPSGGRRVRSNSSSSPRSATTGTCPHCVPSPAGCAGPRAGGTLLAVHWLGNSSDHLQRGHEVHDVLRSVLGPSDCGRRRGRWPGTRSQTKSFTIERWTRP